VMRAAARWAHTHRAASIMVTDTWAGDKRRYFPVERAKALWCRARYDGVFIPGVRSQEYFASMGFPPARIWRGVAVVDNDYFADQAANVRLNQDRVRQALGLPGRYFLCVARLSPEKNLVRLISAFDNYRRQGGSWQLVFVGSGPQEEQLRSLAADMAGASIQFAGWRQYPDLPAYYALASCLVLPSLSEPWGLVVNEAMACGLPILVSRKCGCQPELCWRGINGYDFDPYDTGQLAKLMLRISTRESDLAVMGQASREIIASFTPDRWAQALLDCIETVGTCLPRPAQGRKK
jgi:1,2-diacylglycerol 3-alpha-glucosyltransferase